MKENLKILALTFLCVLGVISCDEVDLTFEAEDVQGIWVSQIENSIQTYVEVTDSKVKFYDHNQRSSCVSIISYTILEIQGTGFYRLGLDGSDIIEKTIAFSVNGNKVRIRDVEDEDGVGRWLNRTSISSEEVTNLAPACPDENVFGKWKLDQADSELYLSITSTEINIFEFISELNCYFNNNIEVKRIEGALFYFDSLDENDEVFEDKAELTFIDGVLNIKRTEEGAEISETYLPIDIDLTTLSPICEFDFKRLVQFFK